MASPFIGIHALAVEIFPKRGGGGKGREGKKREGGGEREREGKG